MNTQPTFTRGRTLAGVLAAVTLLALAIPATPVRAATPDEIRAMAARTEREGHVLKVWLDLPQRFAASAEFDELFVEEVVRSFLTPEATDDGVRAVIPFARNPEAPGEWLPLVRLLPPIEPVPEREWETRATTVAPPLVSRGTDAPGAGAGALSGKTVYVSQGHGWYWSAALGKWITQRGNTNGIIEDFVNAEAINQYFIRYLRNAGAHVVPMREADTNPNMAIVDDGVAGKGAGDGTYTETGTGWYNSTQKTFGIVPAPYANLQNPFEQGVSRMVEASSSVTATATFVPTVPAYGVYHVYIAWAAWTNRLSDAHITVHHLGGTTDFRVDQTRHGKTWVFLGEFAFAEGSNPDTGKIVVSNDTANPTPKGHMVSVDAVRLGGGMSRVKRGTGTGKANGPTANRPHWEDCARYHAQILGAPSSVYDIGSADNSDDVSTRARFAAWDHEAGEDAVFVSWHSNAPSPARGTSTYVYGPNPADGTYQFAGVAGSDKLAKLLHNEIVKDIRGTFDPKWRDLGVYSAYFGEINPNHNNEMPSVLTEVAFHDTAADAEYMKDPKWRQVVARAMAQSIVKYFAQRDKVTAVLPPDNPANLRVKGQGWGGLRVEWDAPTVDAGDIGGGAATSYRVYVGDGPDAYGNPIEVTTPYADLTDLEPSSLKYVRVTAVNAGGESFSTPTLAATVGCGDSGGRVLAVYGFYRLDKWSLVKEDLSAFGLGTVNRLFPERINTFDYTGDHVSALMASGALVDSAEAGAVSGGAVSLSDYWIVDWIVGEETVADETLSAADQAAIQAYLSGGGNLLLSGAEIAWDLSLKGTTADKEFLQTWLHATYSGDDGESYVAQSVAGTDFEDLGNVSFDDGTHGVYDVDFPDQMKAGDGATLVFKYPNGTGAGIAYKGDHRVVFLGFPIEAVYPQARREALVSSAVMYLGFSERNGAYCSLPPEKPASDPEITGPGADSGLVPPNLSEEGTDDVPAAGTDTGSVTKSGGDDGCTAGAIPGSASSLVLLALAGLAAFRRRRS